MDVALLGPLEIRHRGRRIEIGGAKQRLVLAHLLLSANRVVSTDGLIDDVWGDEPPDAVRNTLQAYISRLRRALGDAMPIEGRTPGYVLHLDPDRLDSARFESLLTEARRLRVARPDAALGLLQLALGLWRGPALADLADEPSLQPAITRLEELRMTAIEQRMETELAVGSAATLVGELEALTRRHPHREPFWGQLMIALYRAGRQGDAAAAYLRARSALVEELGVEPSRELQALQQRILEQDPALADDLGQLRGYGLRERVGSGPRGVVYRAIQPHVGREVALKVLDPALTSTPDFVRRFEVEALFVARLEHPNLVPLLDSWRGPEGAFVVWRWLRGGSLRAALDRGDRLDAMRIATQVGHALEAAHRAGVVHGNLHAGNVLLDEEGNAYLGDVPIGLDVGTDAAVDRTPAGDQAALAGILRRLVDAGAPPGADEVLARAADADPARRYPDIGAMLADLVGKRADRATGTAAAIRNPYKGLRPFAESDATDFFGRAGLARRLADRIGSADAVTRFLALVGASGSGKSSLVHAGLVPALRARPDGDHWFVATMYPGGHPFAELDEALLRVAVAPPPTLIEALWSGPRGLLEAVDRALPPDGSELLLVVDQLEELFTLTRDETIRQRFLELLVTAVSDPGSRVRVIVTLRADFFDRPLAHGRFARLLHEHTVPLGPLGADELGEAVGGPAALAGVNVEPALAAAVVGDVVDQPGALPLLQYTLTELFDRRRSGGMTIEAYRGLGGIAGAIAHRADQLYGSLGPEGREVARQVFLRLVTIGDGPEQTRRRVRRGELDELAADEVVGEVLGLFGGHRLLSFDRDPRSREPTVEVAHEALLQAWGRLRGWIADARDELREHGQLAAAAADWEEAGRDPGDLWRGPRLEAAAGWLAAPPLALTGPERAFLAASVAQRDAEIETAEARQRHELELERRSVRRLRALAAALATGAFVAAVLTGLALTERGRAETAAAESQVRELVAAAGDAIDRDPELSVLLALEAIRMARQRDIATMPEAETALHRALAASRLLLAVREVGASPIFSPDGSRIVVDGPEDGPAIVLDAGSGEIVHRLAGHAGDVNHAIWSPDGASLVTVGEDGTARVWDADTGRALRAIRAHVGHLGRPDFSPDGTLLATTGDDGSVRVWDIATGSEHQAIADLGHPISVSFSPDGRRLAIALVGAPGSTPGGVVWDLGSETVVHALAGGRLIDIAYSPDGSLIGGAGDEAIVEIWDADSGARVDRLIGHAAHIVELDWGEAGRLASASADGEAIVWEVTAESSREVFRLTDHEGVVGGVSFSHDGLRLVTGDTGGETVRVWDATSGAVPEVAALAVAPEGPRVAYRGGDIVAPANGGGLLRLDASGVTHHGAGTDPIIALDIADGGSSALSVDIADRVHRWDLGTGVAEDGWKAEVFAADIAALDDGRIAVASWNESVVFYDATGRFAGRWLYDEPVTDLDRAASGDRLAVGSRTQIEVVDLVSDEAIVFATGTAVGDVGNAAVAFSPDGDRLLGVLPADRPAIWAATSGQRLARLDVTGVVSVAWSPDGATVATGAENGTIRLWDAATGRHRLTLDAHAGGVTGLAFSEDGRRLASAGTDGMMRVWAIDIDDLVAMAASRVTRSLTDAECAQYLHGRCPRR